MWIKMMIGFREGVFGFCFLGRRRFEEFIFLKGLWELRVECFYFFGRVIGG